MIEQTINIERMEDVVDVFGSFDENIKLVEHELGVTDREILDAVRYHTTARAGMTLLDKVLYLADFVSADRDYEGVEALRALVHQDLEAGLREALSFSIAELLQKPAPIHRDTVEAWNAEMLQRKETTI